MPCDSSYLEPSEREKELRRAARLFIFVRDRLKKHVEPWIFEQANTLYAHVSSLIPMLCDEIKGLSESEMESIVYDGHDKNSRDLANWWERHLQADRERDKKETALKHRQALRKSALGKLTPEEREALEE